MIIQTALFLLFIILILIICLIVLQSININGGKIGGLNDTKTGTKTSNILLKYGGSMEGVKIAVDKLIAAYEENGKNLIRIQEEKEGLQLVLNRVSAIEEEKHKNIEELNALNGQLVIIQKALSTSQAENSTIKYELAEKKDIIEAKEGALAKEIKLKEEQINVLIEQARKVRPLTKVENYEGLRSKKPFMNYNNAPTDIIEQGTRIEEMIDSPEVKLLKTEIDEKAAEIKSINDAMELLKQEIEELKKEIANDDTDKLEIIKSINKALGVAA